MWLLPSSLHFPLSSFAFIFGVWMSDYKTLRICNRSELVTNHVISHWHISMLTLMANKQARGSREKVHIEIWANIRKHSQANKVAVDWQTVKHEFNYDGTSCEPSMPSYGKSHSTQASENVCVFVIRFQFRQQIVFSRFLLIQLV